MKSIVLATGLLFFTATVYGDAAGDLTLAEIWATAKNQYESLQKQLKTAANELAAMKKVQSDVNFVHGAVTGHYKMGDLVDIPLKDQQWSPGAWADAMQNTADGASVQYLQASSMFGDTHKLLTQTEFVKAGGDKESYKTYKEQWQTARAANAVAETAYNKINKDEADIKAMQKKIEVANNVKAAQDLRNRIAVEQADINVQQQRIKTVQLKLQAEQQAEMLDEERKGVEFEQ